MLSLGAGVQSSVVLMMSELGELPRLDFAVFADTHWEPEAVYKNLEWLEANTTIPIYRVSGGNILADTIEKDFVTMPLHGESALFRRQCTGNYKIAPIRSFLYNYCDKNFRANRIELWLGISYDEYGRMKDSDVEWITNRYPLVDARMTREACIEWWNGKGFPPLPRSACIGCPFHSNDEWRNLSPVEFKEATLVDSYIRSALEDKLGSTYLHFSRKPLAEVELWEEGEGGWGEECQGFCGI